MLAQLIPKQGGAPITLTRAITVVGRSSKLCDLVVEHTNVSKQHCLLVKTDGLIYLRDLGSTNGTRVNEELCCLAINCRFRVSVLKSISGRINRLREKCRQSR